MCVLNSIQTVSIIGAGVMGRGIAAVNLRAGIRVRISDTNSAVAADAVAQILAAHASRPREDPPSVAQSDGPMISVAMSDSEIAAADLVIESVSEKLATKSAVLTSIEPYLRDHTIIATNSSSIPIARLASALKDPSRLCGLHFCHPVSERPLVEVVYGASTDLSVLDRAYQYAIRIGMAPIVVRDSPGFLLNRLLVPYMNEALELLLDGASVEALDQAAMEFGMPLGPLAHFDEFGIDVALAVGRTLYWTFPDRIVPSELLVAMYKAGQWGRKSGSGFYATQQDTSARKLAPGIEHMISERQRGHQCFSTEEITRRLFLPMLLEATRILEEQLVERPAIIDIALRDGLGMTQSYRGLIAWADSFGAARILDWLQPLQSLGKRFEATQLLLSKAFGS